MLMPAAVVIVLLLGAIAVDSAIVYLEQRQAYNVAADAANDAVGAGIDRDLLRTTGVVVYDPARVHDIAAATIAAASDHGLTLVDAAVDEGSGVAVTVEVRIRHLLLPAFGTRSSESLRITARARGDLRAP